MAVDTLDMHVGHEFCAGVGPLDRHDARAVSGLEHLGARAVERVHLYLAALGDVSESIVARDGRAAGCGEIVFGTRVAAAQHVSLLGVDSAGGGVFIVGLFLADAEYLADDALGLGAGLGRLAERFYQEVAQHDFLVAELIAQLVAVGHMICAEYLGYYGVGIGDIVLREPLAQYLGAAGGERLAHLAQGRAQAGAGMGGHQKSSPLSLGLLRLRGEYLHLVAGV